MFVVPANLVAQTFKRIQDVHGEFFNIIVDYGSGETANSKMKGATCDRRRWNILTKEWHDNKFDPEVCNLSPFQPRPSLSLVQFQTVWPLSFRI